MRTVFAILVAVAALYGPQCASAQSATLPPSTFAYDASAPLAIRVLSTHHEGVLTIEDITFPSPRGGTIHGQLILPRAKMHRGGVLFVHWLGDPKTTNLSEFHRDAVTVAQRGNVALSIDAMWAQAHWFETGRSTDTDYANSIHQVIDIRRALDVLLTQPGIVPHRIAYVGHDFGAMYGAVLSGIDPRPRWYVLMAGNPSFSKWYLLGKQPADVPAFVAQMAPLDPLPYLASSKAEEFLFQFANKDEYITADEAQAFAAAAPLPHGMFLYKADHSLDVPEAFSDRIGWLDARLNPAP
ncbi:MAG: hypothetical protein M3N19_04865 [Candidatus Eremiobacteraeota bacterium]|nr:hypothetical protein [Candidatus Eremiobacteraeota bacterium]